VFVRQWTRREQQGQDKALEEVVTRDYLARMRVVGIKQLKAKLSEYLREVRRGEAFLVTDRDQVVAELRPPRSEAPVQGDELDQAMEALAAAGEVQPARAKKEGWRWSPRGVALPPGTAAAVLDEIRSDRSGTE
jgi:antitoxin (DNA-binding transcriptional repressor) of toxin-antitoxin stability system